MKICAPIVLAASLFVCCTDRAFSQVSDGLFSDFHNAASVGTPVRHSMLTWDPSAQPDASPILLTQTTSDASSTEPSGGGNGTNPAQNITTFIVSNEYYTLDGGNRINTTYTRFKYPWFEKRGSLLMEVPFVYYDLEATLPNAPAIGGLGDVKLQGSYNIWSSKDKRFTVINFLEVFLPTADNAIVTRGGDDGNQITAFNLGTGKFVAGPGAGVVYAPAPNVIIAPLYFYEASVFGNDLRPDIRRGKFRLFAMYAWKSGAYALPEFQALTNYLTGDSDFYVAPEVGFSSKGTTAYVKPGIGIEPDPGNRQWGLEIGFRLQF